MKLEDDAQVSKKDLVDLVATGRLAEQNQQCPSVTEADGVPRLKVRTTQSQTEDSDSQYHDRQMRTYYDYSRQKGG